VAAETAHCRECGGGVFLTISIDVAACTKPRRGGDKNTPGRAG